MNTFFLLDIQPSGTPAGYVIGALIAVLILGYLLYSLIKPEKF
jgi:K+-transporting ATPase KdpF subunit